MYPILIVEKKRLEFGIFASKIGIPAILIRARSPETDFSIFLDANGKYAAIVEVRVEEEGEKEEEEKGVEEGEEREDGGRDERKRG